MKHGEILIITFPTSTFSDIIEQKCGKVVASRINEIMLHRNLLKKEVFLNEIKAVGFDLVKWKTFLSPKQVYFYLNTSVLLNKKIFSILPMRIKFGLLRLFTKQFHDSNIEEGTNVCLVLEKP